MVFTWRNSYSNKSAFIYCDPFDGTVHRNRRDTESLFAEVMLMIRAAVRRFQNKKKDY